MFADIRFTTTLSAGVGIDPNVDTIPVGPFPAPIMAFWPNVSFSQTEANTVVFNKVVHRSGVLLTIIERKGSSQRTTTHHTFDPASGRPLLMTVTNAFDQPEYSYAAPARWEYGTMAPAYLNVGVQL